MIVSSPLISLATREVCLPSEQAWVKGQGEVGV